MTSDQASGSLKHDYYHLQEEQDDPFQMTRPSAHIQGSILPKPPVEVNHLVISENVSVLRYLPHPRLHHGFENTESWSHKSGFVV